jgi:hypothetical protein
MLAVTLGDGMRWNVWFQHLTLSGLRALRSNTPQWMSNSSQASHAFASCGNHVAAWPPPRPLASPSIALRGNSAKMQIIFMNR